ncbi:MAG: helix-turn-helix transcriptional regulator [Acidobacteriota bacterium]
MNNNPLDEIDPRLLGDRLRQAREAHDLTQEQATDQSGVASETLAAIEKGARQIRPEELLRLSTLYGCQLWELLQHGELPEVRKAMEDLGPIKADEPLPPQYVSLAVKAWEQAELSEGQLAHVLRTDRIGARMIIERVKETRS